MKFLKDLQFQGKKVLFRADINCPFLNGKITDTTRLRAILPSLNYLLKAGAKQVIILAHQGRKKVRAQDSVLDEHAKELEKLLKEKVLKIHETRPKHIPEGVRIVMLENVRLDDEDHPLKEKREDFALFLSKLGDIYVNDAFGNCHRDHATITSLAKLMPKRAAGLLVEKELAALSPLLHKTLEHPFTIVAGGAKIDTKMGLFDQFKKKADFFLVGGALANTFLKAEGYDVGASLYEEQSVEIAQKYALELGDRLQLPVDVVCADEAGDHVANMDIPVEDVEGDMKILDIGQKTAAWYSTIIRKSHTVVWNGPMGLFEYKPFKKGSEAIAKAMAASKGKTILGGGDSLVVINELEIPYDQYNHVSTGGGAMVEYLSGEPMPGLVALG